MEGTTIAAVNAVLTTTTSLCLVAKVVYYRLDTNDHSKNIVCFIGSEISIYLTEIPELSANCMYSGVNVI